MATLKAGYQLNVIPRNGGTYSLTFDGTTKNGIDNAKCLGPFGVDREYTVTKSGAVEVYSVDQFGVKLYEASELPDPATLAPGDTVVVDNWQHHVEGDRLIEYLTKPSSLYSACFSGNQVANRGSAKNLCNGYIEIYPSAITGDGNLTDAQMWANNGYITTLAGTGSSAVIPLSLLPLNINEKTLVINVRVNASAPASTSVFLANGNTSTGANGFVLRADATGKVQVLYQCGSNAYNIGTSNCTYFDGTDHDMLFVLHPSGYACLFCDGQLDKSFSPNNIYPISNAVPTYGITFGGAPGASGATIAAKFANIHIFALDGIPLNLGYMARTIHKSRGQPLSDRQIVMPEKTVALYWGAGQSNEAGQGNTIGSTGDLGVPVVDAGSGRSIMAGVSRLLAQRKVACIWVLSAFGATAASESWNGRLRSWVSGLQVVAGSYVLSSGSIYKCTNSLGSSFSSTTTPAVGTGADGVTWALVTASPTAEDYAVLGGTGVYPITSSRFDPNGLVALAINKASLCIGKVDSVISLISIGQTDRTVGATSATYSAALQNLAARHSQVADKVLLCMTVRGASTTDLSSANGGGAVNASNTTQESWYNTNLLPGYQDAVAKITAANQKVVRGFNWADGIGALTSQSSPANIGVRSTDLVHMTDATYETKAVPLVDAALRSIGY